MGMRNDLRKAMMKLPDDGSVMTAEDVVQHLQPQPGGWYLMQRFAAHHNAIVNGQSGTERIPHHHQNLLKEPIYRRKDIDRWADKNRPQKG